MSGSDIPSAIINFRPAGRCSKPAYLLTIALLCTRNFSSKAELWPLETAIISRANLSSSERPGLPFEAFSIQCTAYRVRCFSLSGSGVGITLAPDLLFTMRMAGEASSMALRKIGNGGSRVNVWM